MIRFIHTADLHFGVENYGKIDQKTGMHSRLLDFDKAFDFCIETAIKENVDLFLFCGDAYKTAHPSPTQQQLLLKSFLKLYNAQIPVVIIVGNHDHPLSFGKAHALDLFNSLPMNGFYVFSKPNKLTIKTKSGPVQIVGVPWPNRSTLTLNSLNGTNTETITRQISQHVGKIISSFAQELEKEIPAILAAHITMGAGVFSGSEKRAIYGADPIFLPSQLAIEPFDYVALGHLHRYQIINKDQSPPIIYSGSIERIDFGERKDEKGFCLVTIEKKGRTSHRFVKIPTRPFKQIEIHLNEENQTKQILQTIKENDINQAIIKIVYHVPPDKSDLVDLKAIQQACSTAQFLVGIFPIKSIATREKRAQVKLDMSLETLLEEYFKQKPDLQKKSNVFIEKIKNIMQKMEQIDQP